MSPTLTSLCGFAGWTSLLVVVLANYRVSRAIQGKQAVNSFSPDGSDLPGFGQRLTRAHLDCLGIMSG